MKRALLPWVLPVAMILGVLVAVTNSNIVYAAVLILAAWVVLPVLATLARRAGYWPQSLGGGTGDGLRRRFPGFRGYR